jgi:hypothetical protein
MPAREAEYRNLILNQRVEVSNLNRTGIFGGSNF